MINPFIIDASHVFPLTGGWQEVGQREASNMVSTWTERLCLSQTEDGYALAMCIFGPCVLHVGSRSQKLLDLFSNFHTKSAAFITAENPLGNRLADGENRLRVNALLADAKVLDLPCFEGEGVGEDPSWAPERSALLLGLTFEQAVHLGRYHEQNAIIWAGEDAVPKLVILR